MRVKHKIAITVSGFIWLLVGLFLLYKGLFYSVAARVSFQNGGFPLLNLSCKIFKNTETAALVLVFLGLIMGRVKGKYALAKSAKRNVKRLLEIPAPLYINDIFPLPYILLVIGMMILGMSLKYLKVPYDIRGFIDVAVGSGLINGAVIYFKLAALFKREYERKN